MIALVLAATLMSEGDVFVQTSPDGSDIRRERLGQAEEGKPPIVGAWRYRHYTKAIAFERYTDGGRLFFRLPMSSSRGCYLLKADDLLLTQSNRPDAKMTMVIRGDDLSLVGSDGRKTAYRRVGAGAWYDREHIDVQR